VHAPPTARPPGNVSRSGGSAAVRTGSVIGTERAGAREHHSKFADDRVLLLLASQCGLDDGSLSGIGRQIVERRSHTFDRQQVGHQELHGLVKRRRVDPRCVPSTCTSHAKDDRRLLREYLPLHRVHHELTYEP
jgi:hypothetical protein